MSPPASIPSKGCGGGGGVPGPFYTIFIEVDTLEVRFCFQYCSFYLGSEATSSPAFSFLS